MFMRCRVKYESRVIQIKYMGPKPFIVKGSSGPQGCGAVSGRAASR